MNLDQILDRIHPLPLTSKNVIVEVYKGSALSKRAHSYEVQ